MGKWSRAIFQPNRPLETGCYVTASKEHIALSCLAAGEGMVLLKNEDGVLPLKPGTRVAGFGKGLHDYVKGGGGSGDVHAPFVTTLAQGLEAECAVLDPALSDYYLEDVTRQYAGGADPGMTLEPAVPEALLKKAAARTDTALIVLSRFSGEGWDRIGGAFDDPEENPWKEPERLLALKEKCYPKGDFCLTDGEKALIRAVRGAFSRVIVVLNIGGVMDTAWIRDDERISAALLMWQGGMAGGTAAAKILMGKRNPSGRLPDTFAASLEDYPSTAHFHDSPWYVTYEDDIYVGYRYFETLPGAADRVVYPFGYGLSYTRFKQACIHAEERSDALVFDIRITNTGRVAGREATAIYYRAPQGKLGRPARELGAFAKTKLLAPGESEVLELSISKRQMAAFDDLGKIAPCALVLEEGTYLFYLGANVREASRIDGFAFALTADMILTQLSDALKPNALPHRLLSDGSFEQLPTGEVPDLNACAFEKMKPGTEEGLAPASPARGGYLCADGRPVADGAAQLIDVAEGRVSMETFLKQLSDEELIRLTGGVPNTGVANTFGFGGNELFGIPAVMTADGPAGVRISPETGIPTTAWPCETLLAATWDESLLYEVGRAAAAELKENNLQVWLAPAMNIHRNPMCGRNFEYYSEDPYLSGKMGAAEVRGIQSMGVSACIKHFAANNKETNRKNSDSRVSMRALREIYLRGFEIAVKEGAPGCLMSAYNAINGQRASESADLLTKILRDEWGFDGAVTTDWWTRGEHYKEILAGNDVKMGTGFPERVQKALDMGAISREDIETCAGRVLRLICRLD